MLTIVNRWLPFKGFVALTIFPFVFVRKEYEQYYDERMKRHEACHARQQLELLFIGFYLLYALEYVVGYLMCHNHLIAYKSISFECEARHAEEHQPHWFGWARWV